MVEASRAGVEPVAPARRCWRRGIQHASGVAQIIDMPGAGVREYQQAFAAIHPDGAWPEGQLDRIAGPTPCDRCVGERRSVRALRA